jgi:hypothetical protein
MTVNFVSEVDRKFYSNNLLTNDDWGKYKKNKNQFICQLSSCDGFSYYYRFFDIAINSVDPSFI